MKNAGSLLPFSADGPLAVIGALAALLVKFGNPGNMGICVACFTRDIAGALVGRITVCTNAPDTLKSNCWFRVCALRTRSTVL